MKERWERTLREQFKDLSQKVEDLLLFTKLCCRKKNDSTHSKSNLYLQPTTSITTLPLPSVLGAVHECWMSNLCVLEEEEKMKKSQTYNHLSQVREITTTRRILCLYCLVRVSMKKSNLTHTHLSHKKFSRCELVTQVREFTMVFTTMSSTITKGC